MSRPTRPLGTSLALAALLAASACATSEDTEAAVSTGQGWSFTDDVGTTVELDARPERVAGLNDAVSSLWNHGIAPVATVGQTSAADDVQFEGRDLSGVEIVGESYGAIDLEALAAADPDVVVTTVYPVDSEGTLDDTQPLHGVESLEQQEQVAQIAPIVAIAWRGSAALTEAASSGVTVLPVAAYPDEGFSMAKAPDDPSLRLCLYGDLGVQFVDPGGDGYSWQTASWEDVPRYPSDVVLHSLRGAMTAEEVATQPTYRLLPAARAGQVHPWEYAGMDRAAQARCTERLAGWLAGARKVTQPLRRAPASPGGAPAPAAPRSAPSGRARCR